MTTKNKIVKTTEGREIKISRILNAPREVVWRVWTEPEHITQWWGPNGFTTTIQKMDVRVGGVWLHTMHGWGQDFPNEIIFTEVVKPERIVYTHTAPKFETTVTFEPEGDKTRLTMIMVFDTVEELKFVVEQHGAIEGQKQTIARLEEHLAQLSAGKEFTVSRVFNAPRKLVYQVFSEAKHMAQWWGPAGLEKLNISQFEFRPEGTFLYSMQSPDGQEMWGKFVYKEIIAPERVVFINSFSDKDGNVTRAPFNPAWPREVLNIMTLSEHEGKTTLTLRGGPINATEEEQKAFESFFSSMEQGFGGTFDQLDKYLTEMNK